MMRTVWSLFLTAALTISSSLQQDSYGPVRRGTTRTTTPSYADYGDYSDYVTDSPYRFTTRSPYASNRSSNRNRNRSNGNTNSVYSDSNSNRYNDNYDTVNSNYNTNRDANYRDQQRQQYGESFQYGQANANINSNRRRQTNSQRTSTPGYQDYSDYDTYTNSINDDTTFGNNVNGNRRTSSFNQQQQYNRRNSNAQSSRGNSWSGAGSNGVSNLWTNADGQGSWSGDSNNNRWNSNANSGRNNNRLRASGNTYGSSQSYSGNNLSGYGNGTSSHNTNWSNLFGTSSGSAYSSGRNNSGLWSSSSSGNQVFPGSGYRPGSSSLQGQQGDAVWQSAIEVMRGNRGAVGASEISSTLENAVPGRDYPTLSVIPPTTSFRCDDRKQPGFYADPEQRCQVFRRCDVNGNMYSFLCPNMTLFNQVTLTCDWFYNVDCNSAVQFYDLANSRLYNENLPLLGN
ncbi:hypothetical protein RvY_04485 [Ramazzottius varieornatus]|uniref:Chitin-binding type-2 domain-containing protein n=1 Tax=Ramazzottius varieornatus TaxID=947166 RepID=A0A1D1UXI7_RAMVA|nr:hypothetical protein RvY_04485 [Ramazzottius varieornatus]